MYHPFDNIIFALSAFYTISLIVVLSLSLFHSHKIELFEYNVRMKQEYRRDKNNKWEFRDGSVEARENNTEER